MYVSPPFLDGAQLFLTCNSIFSRPPVDRKTIIKLPMSIAGLLPRPNIFLLDKKRFPEKAMLGS